MNESIDEINEFSRSFADSLSKQFEIFKDVLKEQTEFENAERILGIQILDQNGVSKTIRNEIVISMLFSNFENLNIPPVNLTGISINAFKEFLYLFCLFTKLETDYPVKQRRYEIMEQLSGIEANTIRKRLRQNSYANIENVVTRFVKAVYDAFQD